MSKLAKLTQVVIGIIKNSNNEVLLSTRHHKSDFSDYLEFPGGKKKPYETTKMALKRELKEELSKQLTDKKLFKLFKELETPLIFILFKMEREGFKINEKCKFSFKTHLY